MSDRHYDFNEIEKKWQSKWKQADLFRTEDSTDKPKFYGLDFFPYPSGAGLSVGHCRNYIPTDVACRYRRMKGYNVLHPMGWDAFGLPAENEAINKKSHPKKTVPEYVATYKRQMDLVGIGYDWSREINSSHPDYYKWTQWIFLLLYKRGLAYRSLAPANWCPTCATVLANEEVADGRCWRCDSYIEKKDLPQWFFKITAYADRLIDDLDAIDWPESIKAMQRNWIGRSEGADVVFHSEHGDEITVYTTRPDTLWGATFMVLAPEHPLVEKLTTADKKAEVDAYRKKAQRQSAIERQSTDKEKTGVFTGAYAINPVNNEKIPIWIADYIMMGYGTGAIMAVPAHDERDFAFARKFGIKIVPVIRHPQAPADYEIDEAEDFGGFTFHPEYGDMFNSGEFTGALGANGCAKKKVTGWLAETGRGKAAVNYKLRDWLISRQRYWGAPIPMIHCPKCGEVPVPESDLPVVLPDVERYQPSASGESPLANISEFVDTTCPKCGCAAKRETDTMGGFACSSWYFLRFVSPHLDSEPFDKTLAAYWLPVDLYVGGAEHAVMHLLYARFWTKVLHDEGLIPFVEPFAKLMNQGMVLANTPHRTMEALDPSSPEDEGDEEADHDLIPLFPEQLDSYPADKVIWKYVKMSKSKRNVITPDAMAEEFGADSLRTYELFVAPFEDAIGWSEEGMKGAHRFLGRVWRLINDWNERFDADWRENVSDEAAVDPKAKALRRKTHRTIEKVSRDIEDFAFNTAVAALMEMVNEMYAFAAASPDKPYAMSEAIENLILLLSPMVPHIADELWAGLPKTNKKDYTLLERWPSNDPEVARADEVEIVIQIKGKIRDKITIPADADEKTMEQLALASEKVKADLDGKTVRKVIVVKGKLVNIVVG